MLLSITQLIFKLNLTAIFLIPSVLPSNVLSVCLSLSNCAKLVGKKGLRSAKLSKDSGALEKK